MNYSAVNRNVISTCTPSSRTFWFVCLLFLSHMWRGRKEEEGLGGKCSRGQLFRGTVPAFALGPRPRGSSHGKQQKPWSRQLTLGIEPRSTDFQGGSVTTTPHRLGKFMNYCSSKFSIFGKFLTCLMLLGIFKAFLYKNYQSFKSW